MDKFLLRYPEFQQVSQDRIEMALSDAELQISSKYWRKLYEPGLHALAAHILTVRYGVGGAGDGNALPAKDKTSKTAGKLSVGYGSNRAGFENEYGTYATTTYGQRYLELLDLIKPTLMVV